MGFSGLIVAFRATPRWSSDADDYDIADYDGDCAAGWRVATINRYLNAKPSVIAEHLRIDTPLPMFIAQVTDSDCALVTLAGPSGLTHRIWLQVDGAVGFEIQAPHVLRDDGSVESFYDDADYLAKQAEIRERLVAEGPGGWMGARTAREWALSASLTPASVEDLIPIVDGDETFVESLVWDLIRALGVIPSKLP